MLNKEVISYLSLGSNMKNKIYFILSGLKEINSLEETEVLEISSFYETEPWGLKEQENFYNIVAKIRTKLPPLILLKKLQEIEKKLLRERIIKWGPRTLDIDIIFYGNLNLNLKELTIPHKRFSQRNFVLKPLMELCKDRNLNKFLKEDCGKIDKIIPKVGVSSCLLGKNTKYNGGNNKNKFILMIGKKIKFIDVCPETFGKLECPRSPSEIKNDKVYSREGKDVTEEFNLGSSLTLNVLKKNEINTVILKAKSPSCGYGLIYDGTFSGNLIEGNGVTSDLLMKNGIDIISI